jgi:hypothetical protein
MGYDWNKVDKMNFKEKDPNENIVHPRFSNTSERPNYLNELQAENKIQTYLSKVDIPSDPSQVDPFMFDVQNRYDVDHEQKVKAEDMRTRTSLKKRKPKN